LCNTKKGNTVKCKSVFVPGIARRLLKMGNPIYDIKPLKENPVATIFIFEQTDKFNKDFLAVKLAFNDAEESNQK